MLRRLPIYALVLAACVPGCNRPQSIDGSQFNQAQWETRLKAASLDTLTFTRLYGQALAAQASGSKVQLLGSLHLSVTAAAGGNVDVFLDNAWAEASRDPEHRPEICARYITSLLAIPTISGQAESPPDTNAIVAVVRDAVFLEQSKKFEGTTNALVSEPLAADIYVFYACDSERGMAYLTEGQRKTLGLSLAALRPLALVNLHRILPSLEVVGPGPIYMLKADGNYESSLLLANKLWNDRAAMVQGELVAAVPARDVLLFTGSASTEDVKHLREAASKIHDTGSHVISKTLLVRRNDKWVEWK